MKQVIETPGKGRLKPEFAIPIMAEPDGGWKSFKIGDVVDFEPHGDGFLIWNRRDEHVIAKDTLDIITPPVYRRAHPHEVSFPGTGEFLRDIVDTYKRFARNLEIIDNAQEDSAEKERSREKVKEATEQWMHGVSLVLQRAHDRWGKDMEFTDFLAWLETEETK